MDTELARTFLEVLRCGSFIYAAERLHLAQTTVTARIQALEQLLDARLFIRNRAGARLTPAGERFVPYATRLVQTWERARTDLGLPQGHRAMLALGGETSLWNPLLSNWLLWVRQRSPDVALQVTIDSATPLLKQVESGLLDAALVYQPAYFPGLQVELLLEEKLVMVQAGPDDAPYCFVDWGPDFVEQHDAALPGWRRTALSTNLGPLVLQHLLTVGGRAYLRARAVQPHLECGELVRVPDMPEFTYPVCLVHAVRDETSEALATAIDGLRQVARAETDWSLRRS